ncbi:LAME_0G05446g1_1 [Lachancea meyersii CBS 8951]|uniref:LAME_0G05446g1_1 n=1 Tax=Lachancea meyersii CBS 8951 TaxID=1266667 RepID=A0A1G4K794_9SACH|nr:LAME_0G05446g1_1 [Lachancea meyersii CBS 8951]
MNRVAIGQICSSCSLTQNLKTINMLIDSALLQDVKVIFFPEASDYISRSASHSKKLVSQSPEFADSLCRSIPSLCQKYGKKIDVSIGVHLPAAKADGQSSDDRVRNCLLYINHRGEVLQSYQKLHLFDVDVPNGPVLKESESVQPGSIIAPVLDTPVGKLGSAICFDIRFPELSLKLRSKGAEILCFPSAFTVRTGEAHWEALAKARALDTQCYVLMPAQQGEHQVNLDLEEGASDAFTVKRVSWGHSMIVDPWGQVIARADSQNSEAQLIMADLDFAALEKIRKDMPLWDQRRRDVFGDYV